MVENFENLMKSLIYISKKLNKKTQRNPLPDKSQSNC